MHFDTQNLLQFWQAAQKQGTSSTPIDNETAVKFFENSLNPPWLKAFGDATQSNTDDAGIDQMATLLRQFVHQLTMQWQASQSSIKPVDDPLTAHEVWNQFIDMGSAEFLAMAGSDDFASSLAKCINTFSQASAVTNESASTALWLAPPMPDTDPAPSERDVLFEKGTMTVYRYAPQAEPRAMAPVLIVYALINTADILDLDPERSLVSALLREGIPVYLVDWGYPTVADHTLGLTDYIHDRLKPAIDAVVTDSASEQVNLFGVCQGGVLSLSTAALYPQHVRKLALAVTPIDFHTPSNLLTRWARGVDVAALVQQHGNIPGAFLYWMFASLNPFELIYRKYLKAAATVTGDGQVDEGALRRFMRMERWVQDVPDHAGRAFEEFVTALYQNNALVKDEFTVGKDTVKLSSIRQPILNAYATRDHIVPTDAARALSTFCTDYTEVELSGGHIGALVSERNIKVLASRLSAWL